MLFHGFENGRVVQLRVLAQLCGVPPQRARARGELIRVAPQRLDSVALREQRFLLRAIQEDLDLGPSMDDAVTSLRIVIAADESIRLGQVVTL